MPGKLHSKCIDALKKIIKFNISIYISNYLNFEFITKI